MREHVAFCPLSVYAVRMMVIVPNFWTQGQDIGMLREGAYLPEAEPANR
jgi:hypothetical protein